MSEFSDNNKPFVPDSDSVGMKATPVPKPEKVIDIDTQKKIIDNIIEAGQASSIDIGKIDAFSRISQDRESVYELIDTMSEDARIASVLEIYAEDATETNNRGKIVWCESGDANVQKYITFLLDTMNVDKSIYKWVYSLCKYGDLYLRLYHKSEFEDTLSFNKDEDLNQRKSLKEDVILKTYGKNDNYVHYVEMVPNPAEMFELTKFGKSSAYIKAPISANLMKQQSSIGTTYPQYKYQFKSRDVIMYDPTVFVHAALEDNSTRNPEEVDLFYENRNSFGDGDEQVASYTVRRGQSILYNTFKIWRQSNLLENSMLLNRLTKSSIVRIFNIEVGDMPKENVRPHLMGIKNLIEQKSAIDLNNSMSEYTNPGPMENNVYVPMHGGLGSISTQEIGGDTNVTGLADIDYFTNKLYSSLKVPKQYIGDTDDATGFNGGTSLSLVSSRYAKTIKRIQNTTIQALTDAINLMLLDKGLDNYVNKFQLKMQSPTTQEERDRQDNLSTQLSVARDIVDMLADVENVSSRLKIAKTLISEVIPNEEIQSIIEDEIEKLAVQEGQFNQDMDADMGIGPGGGSDMHVGGGDINIDMGGAPGGMPPEIEGSAPEMPPDVGGPQLPTPEQLNAGDFADANNAALA